MIETAQKYIDSGLLILPVKKTKEPAVNKWKDIEFKANDFKGTEGIGIICGEIECIDFDNHFGDAKETLTQFIEIPEIKEIYDKYKLPIESTQSGGYHLIYRCSEINGNQKLAQKPKWNEDLKKFIPDTIIETRGKGGYFVAAPTQGYKIVKNNILKIEFITPEERSLLLSYAKSFNKWSEPKKNEYENTDRPGDLYNNDISSIQEMKNLLLGAGWNELKNNIWQRPGKKKGISATLGQIAPNIFYNFSSNGYPFEPNTAYTPFQVLSLLKYNSDFSECAKDLSNKYTPIKQIPKKEITDDKLKNILEKSIIDTKKVIEKPPIIFQIAEVSGTSSILKRVFTLGNFSAIIGKAKSKKTFFLSMVSASLIKNTYYEGKLYGNLSEDKRQIVYFDTEQGYYDGWITANRIEKMSGGADYFGYFSLREYTPIERCEIIEYAFTKLKNVGYVVIDGIADLATAINDEIEATRVTSLLLKWTKLYNCHISIVIHQNKGDNFATGHLGSSIMKKAEAVISVTKDSSSSFISHVECDFMRGASDFNSFRFMINDNGIPEIMENEMKVEYNDNLPI